MDVTVRDSDDIPRWRRQLSVPVWLFLALGAASWALTVGVLVFERGNDAKQAKQIAEQAEGLAEVNADTIDRIITAQVTACRYRNDLTVTLTNNQHDILATSIPVFRNSPYADAFPEEAAATLKVYEDDLARLNAIPLQSCAMLALRLRGRLSLDYSGGR